jgi:hypothetical protein
MRKSIPMIELMSRTMTVQLASARTPSGNTDLPEPSSEDSNLNLTLSVNSNELIWTILYNQSSSCSDRNGIGCYNLRHLSVHSISIKEELMVGTNSRRNG